MQIIIDEYSDLPVSRSSFYNLVNQNLLELMINKIYSKQSDSDANCMRNRFYEW